MNPDPMTPLVKAARSEMDDAFERSLLRAAQRERAPEGAERRLLVAIGVGGGSALSAFLGTKWAARLGTKGALASIAIIAGVIGASAWLVTSPAEPESPPVRTLPTPVVSPSVSSTAGTSVPVPETDSVPSTRVEDLPTSPVKAAPAAPAASTATGEPSLAREITLLEEARAALGRGDVKGTLQRLDTHDREFATGPLLPESKVLRIEALVQAGGPENTTRARALGESFLAAHPSGPQARRVRAVLDRAP